MPPIKEDIKCPKCKKKKRVKMISEPTKEMIPSIIDRTFFSHTCKYCDEVITLDYPLKITTENYIVYYTPTVNETIKDKTKNKIKRVCDTYDDLKEKLLILEDNIDDIVIEFIKGFYLKQLDEETRKNVSTIRYNCIDNNNIVLSLIGANKSIACPMFFYQEILRRSRTKKTKYAVQIDSTNYNKYYKMRLFL